jgi:NitT/TauT family transport system ATP-binding protein
MIRLTDVGKTFTGAAGSYTAVTGVGFEIGAGKFVSIVGPSGCGKSTLLTMIAGLTPATQGRIEVAGRPVASAVPENLGYLFQRDALLPWKTVFENVALPLVIRKRPADEIRQRADRWIRRVGLGGFERYYPHQLSGGMRKRVSLATTLIYEPAVCLMDEPFSALDVQTRNLMENELLELWAETGTTVVFVTHDLEEAIALSDEVLVLTAGPGRIKAAYRIALPRPRNVIEIRFREEFTRLYEQIWKDLRDEVEASYARRA